MTSSCRTSTACHRETLVPQYRRFHFRSLRCPGKPVQQCASRECVYCSCPSSVFDFPTILLSCPHSHVFNVGAIPCRGSPNAGRKNGICLRVRVVPRRWVCPGRMHCWRNMALARRCGSLGSVLCCFLAHPFLDSALTHETTSACPTRSRTTQDFSAASSTNAIGTPSDMPIGRCVCWLSSS